MDYKMLFEQYNNGDIGIEDLNLEKHETSYTNKIKNYLAEIKNYDKYTYTHCIRVGLLSLDISNRIGCDKDIQTEVYFGGLIHDIGKIHIPKRILNKPDKLTNEEFEIIKLHSLLGTAHVFNSLPYGVIRIIRDHHEKLDGTGYPRKITKDHLNFQTRIVSVADIIDGYSSNRPYHTERNHTETMKFMEDANGLDNMIINQLIGNTDFHFKRLQHEFAQ